MSRWGRRISDVFLRAQKSSTTVYALTDSSNGFSAVKYCSSDSTEHVGRVLYRSRGNVRGKNADRRIN
jgi:hypothetical protein